MALSANVIFQKTGGSDNAAGGFDPSLTTNMFADLIGVMCDTATPCVSSGSHTAVVGNIGDWLFIGLGANWYRGWYKILSLGVRTAGVSAGGTGYTVGDILTVSGGTGTSATLKVASLGASNAVASVSAITTGNGSPGAYSVSPGTSAIATTGGTGTGCTLNLTLGYNLDAAVTTTTYTTSDGRSISYTLGKAQSYHPLQTGGAYQTFALNGQFYTNTTQGCASVAAPSSGTWSIDRSRRVGGAIFATGNTGTVSGSNLTPNAYTASKIDVGNLLQIVSGTGVTVTPSAYSISNISGSAWVLDRAIGGTGVDIVWNLGGSFATIGGFGLIYSKASVAVNQQRLYITGSETVTSASTNVVNGCYSAPANTGPFVEGFNTVCGDYGPGAYLVANGITSGTFFAMSGGATVLSRVSNITMDGASLSAMTTVTGGKIFDSLIVNFDFSTATTNLATQNINVYDSYLYKCANGITCQSPSAFAKGCVVDGSSGSAYAANTNGGGGIMTLVNCIAVGGAGAHFNMSRTPTCIGCVSYKSTGSYGFGSDTIPTYLSCVAYGNTTWGFQPIEGMFFNCAAGSNTSGNIDNTNVLYHNSQFVTLTSDPYAGNNIGGGTDLAVHASNSTWVKPTSSITPLAQDVGLQLPIYGGTAATVAAGGTGYGAGGTFTATAIGGTFTKAATFTATYSAGGVVTSMALIDPGNYSVYPSNPVSYSGGSGSGLTATTYWWIPGLTYRIIGFDAGSGYWILNFAPASVLSAAGGKFRIADFRPNNVAGGGAALRAAGIGAAGQVDAIDIGAVQHSTGGPVGGVLTIGVAAGMASRF